MEIAGATSNPLATDYGFLNTGSATSGLGSLNAMQTGFNGGGDNASFSLQALSLSASSAASNPFDATNFTTTSASTKLGSDSVSFNKTSGAISWNGQTLNLKGFSDGTDDLIVQKDGIHLNVYKGGTAQADGIQLNLDGSQVKDADGARVQATRALAAGDGAMYVNRTGSSVSASGAGDRVIVNMAANANITGGDGVDKIFNFASAVGALDGGKGNTSIYTVGLSAGTIGNAAPADGGDNYVKIVGNMSGGTINLGKGNNTLDAANYALNGVTIKDDAAAASSVIISKSIGAASSITLNAGDAGVKTGTLAANVTFGAGNNNLMADAIKDGVTVTSESASGKATSVEAKTMGAAAIEAGDAAGAVNVRISGSATGATFNMGAGANTIDASGKNLTSVTIADKAGAVSNVLAGAVSNSTITLKGADAVAKSNAVVVSGAIKDSTIDTGLGNAALSAGSLSGATIKMGDADTDGDYNQEVYVKGAVVGSNLKTGAGDDKVYIGGNVSGSNVSFDLGDGDDSFTVKGSVSSNSDITLKMGDGDDTVNIGGAVKKLNYTGGDGKDDVTIQGAVNASKFELGGGVNTFTAQKGAKLQALNDVDITAAKVDDNDLTTVTAGAYTINKNNGNSITLAGDGANVVSLASISGGTNANRLTIDLGDGAGTAAQKLTVAGAASNLNLNTGKGDDVVLINGAVTNADFDLGGGKNSFTAAKGADGSGAVQALKNVNIDAAKEAAGDLTTVKAGAYTTAAAGGNHINLGGDGANSVELASISGGGNAAANRLTIDLGDAAGTAAQKLTVAGAASNLNLNTGKGDDVVLINGAVTNADFDLGGGKNSFTAAKGADGSGAVQALKNVNIDAAKEAAGDFTTVKAGTYTTASAGGNHIKLDGDGANSVELASISGGGSATADRLAMTLGDAAGTAEQKLTVTGAMSNADLTSKTTAKTTINIGGALKNSAMDVSAGGGDGSLTAAKAVSGLTYTGGDGKDSVSISGATSDSSFTLGDGDGAVTVKGMTNVDITAGDGDVTITGGAYKAAAGNHHITLGKGEHTVTLASVNAAGAYRAAMNLGATSSDTASINTLNVAGAIKGLDYEGYGAENNLTLNGAIMNSYMGLQAAENDMNATYQKGGRTRGQTLTNVDIAAADGSAVNLTYGQYVPGAGAGGTGNVLDFGEGSDVKINLVA